MGAGVCHHYGIGTSHTLLPQAQKPLCIIFHMSVIRHEPRVQEYGPFGSVPCHATKNTAKKSILS